MATVNFSVPDGVKDEFNRYFAGENKSAVLTKLMQHAIQERKSQERRAKAIDAILALRSQVAPISDEEVRAAREEVRE